MFTRVVSTLRDASISFRLVAPLLVFFWGAASSASAQAPTTEDCQACHDDLSAARASGSSVSVPGKVYAESVHGPLACVDCHQDLAAQTEWPHPEKLAKVSCATCHEEAVTKYAASIHAKAPPDPKGRGGATCVSCHGMHDIKPSTDTSSRTHHMSLPGTCGSCHTVAKEFQDSIHGRALSRSGLSVAPNCSNCHGSHDILPQQAAESRVHRTNVPATCGTCHQGIERQFHDGIHGQRLREGAGNAPACNTCHTAHSIARIDTPTFQLAVIQECGTCHHDKIETYRDTFHGQVTALGFERIAKCADCHGAHQVLPKTNPASLVAEGNLVATCGKCHDGANASFVKYDPHPNPRDYNRNPVLWWVNRFYVVLIAGCFSFFGLHSLLWFWRSWRSGEGRP